MIMWDFTIDTPGKRYKLVFTGSKDEADVLYEFFMSIPGTWVSLTEHQEAK